MNWRVLEEKSFRDSYLVYIIVYHKGGYDMQKICSNIAKVTLLLIAILGMDSFLILGTYNYVPDFLEWTLCALVAICFLAVALKSIIAKKK